MAERQTRTREEAESWISDFLNRQPGGSAEGLAIREAARSEGFHEKTIQRAARVLEENGVLFRSLHGAQSARSVTWSLRPVGEDCAVCGHPQAVHGLRGLACRRCPSLACTTRKEKTDA